MRTVIFHGIINSLLGVQSGAFSFSGDGFIKRGVVFMGITVLTLGLASLEGSTIPDHLSGDKVHVVLEGRTPKTKRYPDGHPVYVLVYESGFRCGLKWKDGQATPRYTRGVIPFVKQGRVGWHNQAHQTPNACLLLQKEPEPKIESEKQELAEST